ncbi:DedA family protein [Candidatus Woesearchaeota archaeon]|nr:DedA family protein [Candidatus Woesearchaeota archaeon]
MIVEYLANMILSAVSFFGYFGVFILMAMESMIFPIPSEVVMPFAGFLIYSGKFTFLGVLIASSLGSLFGSLISYYMGKYLGRPIVIKYGKYFLLNKHHLELTERFFAIFGERAVLVSRFIPVVRHIISIPAGIAEMKLKKFSIYTLIGATIWNMVLAFLGFKLGENWDMIHSLSTELDFAIILILVFTILYFIIKRLRNKR